jgi:excinuclease ABC subunit C
MHKEKVQEKLSNLPTQPGCYIWRDAQGDVLYVGKAVNLKNRVNSYFNNYERLDPKIRNMVDLICDVDTYTVDSEVEALILETNLIKKYRPKYNKLMKDDKNYSYVMIDWYNPYPSVKIVREQDDPKAEYYGPYPSRFPIFKVLRRLRKVYPYCEHLPSKIQISCLPTGRQKNKFQITHNQLNANSDPSVNSGQDPSVNSGQDPSVNSGQDQHTAKLKPCFDYHIQLCSGVCAGLATREEHRKNITGIRRFFQGKKLDMIDELKKNMVDYSKQLDYEKAGVLRDRIRDLEYVTQRIRIDKDMDELKLEQMKDALSKRALDELVEKLPFEKLNASKTDFKIECFDISNIQGTNAVASMVVSVSGKAAKNLYRKFKIKSKSTPDDFEMMREALTRRFRRFENSKFQIIPQSGIPTSGTNSKNSTSEQPSPQPTAPSAPDDPSFGVLPDLLIVDGGKGQLSAAFGVVGEFGLQHMPLVGLAKREEEIFYVKNQEQLTSNKDIEFGMVKLPRRSEALYLVQRIRDEAHRFGITFHRNLRSKASVKSILDEVKGVGKVVKKKLMDAFGSIEGIKNAKEEDLFTVVRNKTTVENLKKAVN